MRYTWNEDKNELIKSREWGRWVWFEDVIMAIDSGSIIYIQNPSPNYQDQNIMIVEVNGYPYSIPFKTMENWDIYLITAFPSRKLKSFIK